MISPCNTRFVHTEKKTRNIFLGLFIQGYAETIVKCMHIFGCVADIWSHVLGSFDNDTTNIERHSHDGIFFMGNDVSSQSDIQ